jgi:hydroxyacylglutathione hydrolase
MKTAVPLLMSYHCSSCDGMSWGKRKHDKGRSAMTIAIHQAICRTDNYLVLLHDPATARTISIDAPDADAIEAILRQKGWHLTDILVTHKHHDHVAGIADLRKTYGCAVIAPAKAHAAVPDADRYCNDGDIITIGRLAFETIATPGHCEDHVAYHLPGEALLFAGDALFAMGCGRVLEGRPETLYHSLMRLATLPDDTSVYCGHEYTLANARFALSIESANPAIAERATQVEALRQRGAMTLPTTIGLEKRTNVFLRAGNEERFVALREAKNRF